MQKRLGAKTVAELQQLAKDADRKLETLKRALVKVSEAVEAAKQAEQAYIESGKKAEEFHDRVLQALEAAPHAYFKGDEAKLEKFDESPEGEAYRSWCSDWENASMELDFSLGLESIEVPTVYDHDTVSDKLNSLPLSAD